MKMHFIINPRSRGGKGGVIWQQIEQILKEKGIPHQAHLTDAPGHARRLAQKLTPLGSPEAPVLLVAVGGDGTVNEVLCGISDPDRVLFGYIPTGSGNDFSRGMGIPEEPLRALSLILHRRHILTMDLPELICGPIRSCFGISAGFGYDAAVCQEVSVSPLKGFLNRLHLGRFVYYFIALKQLLFMDTFTVSLRLDGGESRTYQNVYFLAVMNTPFEGGGFMFTPKAAPNDGQLDVILAEGLSKLRILTLLPLARSGRHVGARGLHILRCHEIAVKSPRPQPMHRDGEAIGVHQSFKALAGKKTLRLIVP